MYFNQFYIAVGVRQCLRLYHYAKIFSNNKEFKVLRLFEEKFNIV